MIPETDSLFVGKNSRHKTPLVISWLLLTLLVAFVSSGFVEKYAGLWGVGGYTVVVGITLAVASWFGKRCARWIDRYFHILCGLATVVLTAGFILLHPFEDGKGPGKSSDRDEGLEMAVTRMLEGKNPYYPENKVAGPLSVLPGGILLAAPFVLLGNPGYQNVFWLIVLMLSLAKWTGSRAMSLVLTGCLLVVSPSLQYEFVSGGDLIANGIYVAVLMGFCVRVWSDHKANAILKGLACVMLGIGLASRPNFLLLLPLFGAILWRIRNLKIAIVAATVTGVAALLMILPFYWIDPTAFTPLIARKKLSIVDTALPWAGLAMIGTTALSAMIAAAVLKWRTAGDPVRSFFKACAWVTICPMLLAVGLQSWVLDRLSFAFMHDRFGLMYVFFAILAWGGSWLTKHSESQPSAP